MSKGLFKSIIFITIFIVWITIIILFSLLWKLKNVSYSHLVRIKYDILRVLIRVTETWVCCLVSIKFQITYYIWLNLIFLSFSSNQFFVFFIFVFFFLTLIVIIPTFFVPFARFIFIFHVFFYLKYQLFHI